VAGEAVQVGAGGAVPTWPSGRRARPSASRRHAEALGHTHGFSSGRGRRLRVGLGPAAVRRSGTGQARAVMIGGLSHPAIIGRSRACPAIVHPGTPVDPGLGAAARSPAPPPAGLPPPPHPRPHHLRQAHPDPGVRLRLPPHRRRHLLRQHAAPPPDEWISAGVAEQLRRAVLAAYDRLSAWKWSTWRWTAASPRRPAAGRSPGQVRWIVASRR
jgi:hypothetical protein